MDKAFLEVYDAIKNDVLKVVYQPQINMIII